MTSELSALAWGCVLGFVHIFAAAHLKTRQYGASWNVGARDESLPPPTPLTGRLIRAQANFLETFPFVAAAILIVVAAGLSTDSTRIGAWLWLAARVVYLPLYAAGVPVVRTVAFGASLIGLVMLLWPALSLTL